VSYLFALLTNDGQIEFHEIPSADFHRFKNSLSFDGDVIEYDYVVVRPAELDRRKSELKTKLQGIWEQRTA